VGVLGFIGRDVSDGGRASSYGPVPHAEIHPEDEWEVEMKIRVDALFSCGLWEEWCRIKEKDPNDRDYLEERWNDLVTVPPELEEKIMGVMANQNEKEGT